VASSCPAFSNERIPVLGVEFGCTQVPMFRKLRGAHARCYRSACYWIISLTAKFMLVRTALFHSHDWLITRNCSHHFGPAQAPAHGMYTLYLSHIPVPKWQTCMYVGGECSDCHASPCQVLSTHAYATLSSTQFAQGEELT